MSALLESSAASDLSPPNAVDMVCSMPASSK
jgi:hypothetical protein